MVLTPLQSWALLVALTVGVVSVLWLTSRPTRTAAKRSRRIADDLDDLQRLERARQAIARTQARSNVRLGQPPAKKDTNEQ